MNQEKKQMDAPKIIKIADKVQRVPLSELKPYSKNSKKHDSNQIKKLKMAIEKFGFTTPLIIDSNLNIIAGHGRAIAAKELGMSELPCIIRSDLSEDEIKALRISDNKLNESEWDFDILKEEFAELKLEDFDLELTGFDLNEIDSIIPDETKEIVEDVVEVGAYERAKKKNKIQEGDIFQIGGHRLMCGDSVGIVNKNMSDLLGEKKIDLILTDPPYGNNFGYGRGQLGERRILNDENTEIISKFSQCFGKNLNDKSHVLVWIQWRTYSDLVQSISRNNQDLKLRTVVVWDKKFPGLSGGGFAEQHEWLCVFTKGNAKQTGYSGNVWTYTRNTKKRTESEHPHKKPLELLGRALKLCSKEGEIVADYFGGSGSTMVACEQLNRKCYMMELDPVYCQVIIERMHKYNPQLEIKCINRDFNPLEEE